MPVERRVGLELLHITLLVIGHQHIFLAANDSAIIALDSSNDFELIYELIMTGENHKSCFLIRLYRGRFPGGVRPRYPNINVTEIVHNAPSHDFLSFLSLLSSPE